ncbi:MAG: T9SS type A sorting domain-containing protein [bacterium]|nr:T9SS type A sorting domain-containing protein [bacterium]
MFDTDTLFDDPQVIGPLAPVTYLLTRTDDIFDRYWRVVAQDIGSNLTVCTDGFRHVRKIRPDSTQAFSLLSPDSGSALIIPSGLFSWETAIDPDSLDEQVLYGVYFQVGYSISIIDTVNSTSVIVDFAAHPFIEQSDTVHWWVVADSDYPAMQRPSRQVWTFINWNVPAGETPRLPHTFALQPAYPNPFNASVTLTYSWTEFAEIELSIYDVTGRLVTTLARGATAPGEYSLLWDGTANGTQLSTGLYLARLIAGNNVDTQKLLLLK